VRLRFSAVLGALAVLTGLLFVVRQELAATITLEWTLVLLVAGASGVQAFRFVQNRRSTPLDATETGDPERRYEAPTPGDDADEALRIAQGWSRRGRRSRQTLKQRASEAAAAMLVDTAGCSAEEAAEQIRTGEWTDDPVAAWFLSDRVGLDRGTRLRLVMGSPLSRFRTGFTRAVRAIEEGGGGGQP